MKRPAWFHAYKCHGLISTAVCLEISQGGREEWATAIFGLATVYPTVERFAGLNNIGDRWWIFDLSVVAVVLIMTRLP